MGQRLVIECRYQQESVACIYYHWSAYSDSALNEAKRLVDWYKNWKGNNFKLDLIRFVESCGGCISGGKDSAEWKYVTEIFPKQKFNEDGSRNEGLIALSNKGQSDLFNWAEGRMVIHFDYGIIDNDVYNYYYNADELADAMGGYIDITKLPSLEKNIEEIKFDDIDMVKDYICQNITKGNYEFVVDGDHVIGLIA